MKTKIATVVVLLALVLSGCASPVVVQGTVKSYDPGTKALVMEDEKAPGTEKSFSLEGADVGAEPAPGNLVRLAYLEEGGQPRVIRLMNITKQSELTKSGGGH